MKTVMLAKLKGGAGATTLTRELAAAAVADGQRVALVDLDGQGSLTAWWNQRTKGLAENAKPNPALLSIAVDQIPEKLPKAQTRFDLVLIDVPPSTHEFVQQVMKLCDLAIVPCRPTADDLRAVPPVLTMLREAEVPHAFAITQAPSRARLVGDTLKSLAKRGPVAATVGFRMDFPSYGGVGSTALEGAPDSKSAAEIRELWVFVKENA